MNCYKCGFWDSDYGTCTCYSWDKWYACPIENKKKENQDALKEWGNGRREQANDR